MEFITSTANCVLCCIGLLAVCVGTVWDVLTSDRS